jgi:hypothetical protein
MTDTFHIEVNCQQIYHEGERVCGDVFLSKKIKEEGRVILVLSDGMGHGVKANMLGILTATMALNFTREHKEMNKIAEIIMNTLPIDSEKKSSFSTFTIIDIEADGNVTILEYENPQCLILHDSTPIEPEWACLLLDTKRKVGRDIQTCTFKAQKDFRIVVYTDGVTQSGMGSSAFPTGWGNDGAHGYVTNLVAKSRDISASKLAQHVITEAHKNDQYAAKDDTSCAVIYFREPRKLLICTGPPFEDQKDADLAELAKNYNGKKIICGGTTSLILARELNLEVDEGEEQEDPELPPTSYLDGFEFVTEGVLTLSKVTKILKNYNNSYKLEKGPADQIVRLLLDSDEISFIVGTRINVAHQDPNLPVELEIRRTVVSRIIKILEEKFLKTVSVKYL